jgi:uncharacterized protein (DUF58 family)
MWALFWMGAFVRMFIESIHSSNTRSAAAALVDTFLTAGNRVGLLLYSQYLSWTFPGYGKIQRERILQALARAEVGDSQVFSDLMYLPARLFQPTPSWY